LTEIKVAVGGIEKTDFYINGGKMSEAVVTEDRIKEVLKGRPVLVTGADGFVGSHLTEKLIELGANVHVFVRATSSGMLHNLAHVREKIVVHRGDLTDKQAVTVALRVLKSQGGAPVIFHLGAQAHVGESWNRPYETLATNVLGTVNLLQSIVDLDMEVYRVDVAGSSEEYGNVREDMLKFYRFDKNGGLILDEVSPINPQSVYATSKIAEDFLTRNYNKAYGLPTIVTRMFNNYGPRQNPRFVTGTIITQALSKDTITLGYVLAKRDFCFVRDGVMGHIHVALFGEPGDVYVYGYGETISILDWYNMIIRLGQEQKVWGEKTLVADTKDRGRLGKSEVEELRVDYKKLNRLTGWKPNFSWEQGLGEAINWYAGNREKWIGRVDWI
jgi:dTDP-glucose 4,6-dehydratase